jgi:hypothetical protein
VIAPIGTTAINAVKATQAGMGSAVVTSLRMVGMMLGLAALTSWALAYFKHLASTYPTLPTSATSEQFAQWSQGYAHHLIASAHTVYSAVFFTSMVLCLIAIIPAVFLWGRAVQEDKQEGIAMATASPLDSSLSDPTATVSAPAPAPVGAPLVLPASAPVEPPPTPPTPENGGHGWRNWRDLSRLRDALRNRRRLLLAIASIALVLLLMSLGIFAALTWESSATGGTTSPTGSTSGTAGPGTPAPIAGFRMIELALDSTALTSLFSAELGLQQGVLTDMKIAPTPDDGLVLSLKLHIDASGIHRVMPVELDSTVSIDSSQNIQLHVFHLKRDGLDAGPTAAAHMQKAINQLLLSSIMPALHGQLKSAKLISVHTSSSIGCGGGAEMLVLLIQAPPIQGIAAQPTPTALCFKGPIDPGKLFPN